MPPSETIAAPTYTEIAPCPTLAPWVECYWMIRASGATATPNRVLPDGCSDIILGIPETTGPVAVGTMRTAALYPLGGNVDLFGIRFHPGAGLPFVGVPLSEITDQRVPLDALWRDGASQLADFGIDARSAPHTPSCIHSLEAVLTARLQRWMRDSRDDEPLAERAIALLRQARGGASVRSVAAALGVGERRLERAFDRRVGLGPKAFTRVMRLRRATRRIGTARESGKPLVWTAIAFDAGYADQSHLIREFRALVGITPRQYALERDGVGFVQYDEVAAL